MSNPAVINEITITFDVFKEASKAIIQKKYNAIAAKVALVLLVVLAGIYVATVLSSAPFITFIGEFVILGAVLVYIRFFLPRIELKRAYGRMCQGSTPVRESRFFEDHFLVSTPGSSEPQMFAYTDVLKVRSTPNLLILSLKEGREALVDKNGFTHGSVNDLESLLQQSGSQL